MQYARFIRNSVIGGLNLLIFKNLAGYWDCVAYNSARLEEDVKYANFHPFKDQQLMQNLYEQGRDVIVETLILNKDNTFTVSIARDIELKPAATKVISQQAGNARYMKQLKECPIFFKRITRDFGSYYVFCKFV